MNKNSAVRRFFALLSVDFYKLLRSVAFYVVFGVYALLQMLQIVLTRVSSDMLESMTREPVATQANTLFGNALSYGNIGLFLVIFFAVFLCSEFKTNTIRSKVTLGYSRTCVYFASLTFTYMVSICAVALSCLVNAVIGIPVLGWAHTTYAMQSAFYSLFALVPLVALIHTMAYGSKSMGVTLGVGLPLIIILPTILGLLSYLVYFFKGVEWFTRIVFIALEEFVPVALQTGMSLKNLALNVWLSYLMWTALFIVCGYFSFTKKDIK